MIPAEVYKWMASDDGGRAVLHLWERRRDDQYDRLCGGTATRLAEEPGGSFFCLDCLERALYE